MTTDSPKNMDRQFIKSVLDIVNAYKDGKEYKFDTSIPKLKDYLPPRTLEQDLSRPLILMPGGNFKQLIMDSPQKLTSIFMKSNKGYQKLESKMKDLKQKRQVSQMAKYMNSPRLMEDDHSEYEHDQFEQNELVEI